MSERPAPITRTDEILLHLVDQVAALSDALADRGGAPAKGAPAKADADKPAPESEPAPAKKGLFKKTKAVDGL